jgi:uroporphyrinogen III methyltransferase/synthase
MSRDRGIVYLVGAGPGDPGLITVRGRSLIRQADVIVHDRLIDPRLLDFARPGVERIDAGKAPSQHTLAQDEINAVLIDRAGLGKTVVRLKGGDPFVFGRGGEELAACRAAGVPCIIVPGVTSAIAAPASVGIPLTMRGVARSFAVVTAEGGADSTALAHDFTALAQIDTLVVLMGRASLADWSRQLIAAGKSPGTPVACIAAATTPRQRAVSSVLADVAQVADREELVAPLVTVVGEVAHTANMDTLRKLLPLAGRRIALTAAADTNRRLAASLAARGALSLSLPLIRIHYTQADAPLCDALARLRRYDWVIFTSRHAVMGFFQALRERGRDARQLASCQIAVIGSGSAHALRRWSMRADLVAREHTTDGLAEALSHAGLIPKKRVLYPRSNLSRALLAERFRAVGVRVDDPIAYHTLESGPDENVDQTLRENCDAVVLCSPSAVRAFVRRCRGTQPEIVAAIGPVTAEAATKAGLHVGAVAQTPSPEGVARALEVHFTSAGATR